MLFLKKNKKTHLKVRETFRHLELKKMVLPMRILKRVRNLYFAVSKIINSWHFLKVAEIFGYFF